MNILLCPLSDGGYLYPAIAAGRELRRRGHRVSVLGRGKVAPILTELVLSSGTSAPVLAALPRGRALGVSPHGSEQPLLAGACVRAGVAVRVPNSPTPNPSTALEAAWVDRGLRARARGLGRRLSAVNSAARAAEVIESMAQESMKESARWRSQ